MNRSFIAGIAILALLPLGCGGGATQSAVPAPSQTPDTTVFRFPVLVPSRELPAPYFAYDFKSKVPLDVHLKQVVVWNRNSPREMRLVDVPLAKQNLGSVGVEQFVAELVEQQPDWFVAPIFVTKDGFPLLPTPDILAKITPTTPTTVLDQTPATSVTPFGGLQDTYRITATSRNGFEVLQAANQLAVQDSVVYAEVSFIFTGGGAGDPAATP